MKKWIILMLTATPWGFGTILAWTMRDADCHIFMYFGEGGAVGKQLITHTLDGEQGQGKDMLPKITAWSRAKRLKVMNPGLGRSGETGCIAVYGLMEMTSYSRLIGGTYDYRSDQDECLISSGPAMELFGGLDVAGKCIWYRQKPYKIRGVTDDSSHVILLPVKGKDAIRYMMFVYVGSGEGRTGGEGTSHRMGTGKTAAVSFLYRNEIKSGRVLMDGVYVSAAADPGACLPLWITSIWVLSILMGRRGVKVGAKMRVKTRAKAFVLATIFFLASLLLARKLGLKMPPDLIPDRWSDLKFWSEKIEELCSDMATMGEVGDVWWLAQIKNRLLLCLFCSFAGTAGNILWEVECTGRSGE